MIGYDKAVILYRLFVKIKADKNLPVDNKRNMQDKTVRIIVIKINKLM